MSDGGRKLTARVGGVDVRVSDDVPPGECWCMQDRGHDVYFGPGARLTVVQQYRLLAKIVGLVP